VPRRAQPQRSHETDFPCATTQQPTQAAWWAWPRTRTRRTRAAGAEASSRAHRRRASPRPRSRAPPPPRRRRTRQRSAILVTNTRQIRAPHPDPRRRGPRRSAGTLRALRRTRCAWCRPLGLRFLRPSSPCPCGLLSSERHLRAPLRHAPRCRRSSSSSRSRRPLHNPSAQLRTAPRRPQPQGRR
jgi:hypothetical protein